MKKIPPLYKTLAHIRVRLAMHLVYETAKLLCLAVALFFFVLIPICYAAHLSGTWFVAICGICALAGSFVCWIDVLRPGMRILTLEQTARLLEHRFSHLNGDLISAYQFTANPDDYQRLGVSAHLLNAHIERIAESIEPKKILSDRQSIPHRQFARSWVYIIAVLTLPVIIFSDFYASSLYGTYERFFDQPAVFKEIMVVRPGSVSVPYGDEVTVNAIVFTQQKGVPSIIWSSPHTDVTKKAMAVDAGYRYRFIFSNVTEPITYRVTHTTLQSDEYTITPASLPVILKHTVAFKYPQYTGYEPVEETRAQFDDISALRGTDIAITITANNPLEEAFLYRVRSDSKDMFKVLESTNARLSFPMETSDEYRVIITDIHGQQSQPLALHQLIVIEDEPPSVRITSPEPTMEIPRSMQVTLTYRASDDILLRSSELCYTVSGYEQQVYHLEPAINQPAFDGTYEWDLTELNIAPGDEVSYFVRVYDWYPPPDGPHVAESAVQTLVFPSLVEIYKRRAQVFEEPAGELAKLKTDQATLLEQFQKLSEKIAESESMSWTDKQSLSGMMESQEQINSVVQQQAQSIQEQLQNLDVATDVLQKYSEIQQLMDNLLTDEMKETMRKLNELIEKSESFKELQSQLENMETNLEEFKENLERTLELLKKLAVQNNLEQMVEATEKALENQEQLLEQLEQWQETQQQTDPDAMNENAEDTRNLTEYIDQSVDNLASQEFADEELQQMLNELKEMWDQKNPQGDIADMQQQISQNNPQGAQKSGQKGSLSLAEFKQMLNNMLEKMHKEKQLIADIVDMIRRLLRVSDDLDILSASMNRYQGKNAEKNVDHATSMFFLQNELQRMAQTVRNMSERSPVIDPAFARPLSDVATELSDHTERVFKRGDKNVIPIIRAQVAQIRYEASSWVALLEALMRAQQMGGGGGQMPSDMDDFFKQLQQMAQQQSQLNQQTGMFPQMGQTPSAMQQYLQQLAAQQKMLSEALSQLSQGMSGKNKVLGDLNNIAAQMDKASQQLLKGDVGSELKQRQQRILTRLLEAEKSLTTRDKSKERESKTGEDQQTESPDELDQIAEQKKAILRHSEPAYIPPDYRDLVKKYFRMLMESQ